METNANTNAKGRNDRLGIDIGRVIIDGSGPDTSFFDRDEANALQVPPVAGAFTAIATLVRRFEGRVWLVSKAGARVRARTLLWLDARGFYEATGVARENLRFCRERPEKAEHARELRLTHFIDDRADVLAALRGVVERRYLFGPQPRPHVEPGVIPVADWAALLERL